MKQLKFLLIAIMAAFTLVFTSCEDPITPDPEPDDLVEKYFDIWVKAGTDQPSFLVKNVTDVSDPSVVIDYINAGADITGKLDEEIIFSDGYYYEIPVSADRFGKYHIYDGKLTVIAERPFQGNTYKRYRYTHCWLDKTTLCIMAWNGDKVKPGIIWTKLNTTDMSIIAEGQLEGVEIDAEAGFYFSTSGIAKYRESDGYIIYMTQKKSKFWSEDFNVIFIKASDMSVKCDVKESRVHTMAGTAYGELLQDKTFWDEKGNLYVACNTEREDATSYTQQVGNLLRINKGEFQFDPNYMGHNYDAGKLITSTYMGDNMAILYIQDPVHTNAAGWGSNYNCYFAILDLTTDERTELMYDGKPLPYSLGTFAQFAVVRDGKVYLATNPETAAPGIYIYDIVTKTMTKGLSVQEGYSFRRLVPMEREIDVTMELLKY
ncbi:MAG: hypothetical protein GXY75_06510 [Bacteroidales bacterium]|jgi:hypothetical protein|nr:hypothetical protein [Bacteroidales bacterium]